MFDESVVEKMGEKPQVPKDPAYGTYYGYSLYVHPEAIEVVGFLENTEEVALANKVLAFDLQNMIPMVVDNILNYDLVRVRPLH